MGHRKTRLEFPLSLEERIRQADAQRSVEMGEAIGDLLASTWLGLRWLLSRALRPRASRLAVHR